MDRSDLSADLVTAAKCKCLAEEYALYEYVYLYSLGHGIAPTVREMADATGKTLSKIQDLLEQLKSKTMLDWSVLTDRGDRTALRLRFALQDNSLIGKDSVPLNIHMRFAAIRMIGSVPAYDLYEYLYCFVFKYGNTPHLREMSQAMNLNGTAGIQNRMNRLSAKGFIARNKISSSRVALIPKVPLHDGFVPTHE